MTTRILSKEKIVLAAVDLINHQENLTFTRLSRILGTRSQALYNYFPDVMAIRIGVAIHFYNDLYQRLQADLLGLSGKEAIKAFNKIFVQYSLSHYPVAQQVIAIPAGKLHNDDLDAAILKIRNIGLKLLKPLVPDKKSRLVISRMLRNLIIGEIVHIGNGRFDNKTISAADSFDQMLNIALSTI
ncbi:TetR/AcrR family transcriptional regulator [Companilactobacillus halodurans]|uniref:TetR/AcrR family transcriptional regulator n=1 Tax=Companilactobacillus halodurans TaxID=2584183 RepID=A0A5P0ZQ01_9LACO|nr:TetR/AcrR family transcriptional regulator [Companilactobacillus halodurans]MQS76278.1 TetR/AcrR family transcriptional regulator [Companilactobacillus halodurans]MQS96592.1 TetR/AcrR family transcriptional regulator [Companilactobacillus halodurans]